MNILCLGDIVCKTKTLNCKSSGEGREEAHTRLETTINLQFRRLESLVRLTRDTTCQAPDYLVLVLWSLV